MTVPVMVTDLSYDGCGIATSVRLEPGDPIHLSILERGVIQGEVRWYSDGEAGVVFRPENDTTPRDPGATPRESERFPILAEAAFRRPGRSAYSVKVIDASTHGCRVEFADRPKVGEDVLITFPGFRPMDARVQWVDGPDAGVRFETPFHPAVFELLVQQLTQRRA